MGFGAQRVDGLDQVGEAARHVLVDDGEIEVGVVVALDLLALLDDRAELGLVYVEYGLVDARVLELHRIEALELHGVEVVGRRRTLDEHHVGHELLVAEQLERLGRTVDDAHLARLDHLANGGQLGAVQVAVVLAPLQVLALLDVDLDLLTRLEVVAAAVLLVLAYRARRIYHHIIVDRLHINLFFFFSNL